MLVMFTLTCLPFNTIEVLTYILPKITVNLRRADCEISCLACSYITCYIKVISIFAHFLTHWINLLVLCVRIFQFTENHRVSGPWATTKSIFSFFFRSLTDPGCSLMNYTSYFWLMPSDDISLLSIIWCSLWFIPMISAYLDLLSMGTDQWASFTNLLA